MLMYFLVGFICFTAGIAVTAYGFIKLEESQLNTDILDDVVR